MHHPLQIVYYLVGMLVNIIWETIGKIKNFVKSGERDKVICYTLFRNIRFRKIITDLMKYVNCNI